MRGRYRIACQGNNDDEREAKHEKEVLDEKELSLRGGVGIALHFQLMAEWQKGVPGGLGMVWLGTWAKDNSPTSVAKADKFLDDTFRAMAASNWVGISQVQIHVRTDFSKDDPFCPSTAEVPRIIFDTDMIEDFKDGICYNTRSMEQRQKTRAAVGG